MTYAKEHTIRIAFENKKSADEFLNRSCKAAVKFKEMVEKYTN